MKQWSEYKCEYIERPGLTYSNRRLEKLVEELKSTASTCFETLPDYQVMRGTREELSDKIITVAWREDERAAGFCSTVLLPVPGVGNVLHLGLTCVRPKDRGNRLTHLLTSKAVIGYLLRHRLMGRLWVSNCACVLSSLGNVALHFDAVYPSPFFQKPPSRKHVKVAQTIDALYRDKMYVMPEAELDDHAFVFRSSVKETVFQKSESDKRFHHRTQNVNDYYCNLLDFANGDEALQVGHVSILTGIRYILKKRRLRKLALEKALPLPVYDVDPLVAAESLPARLSRSLEMDEFRLQNVSLRPSLAKTDGEWSAIPESALGGWEHETRVRRYG